MITNQKQISIIGATGNLGIPVVKNLLSFGYELKLIVRNTEKATRIFVNYPKVKIARADLTDIEALKTALSDTEYLYLNLSTLTTNINEPFLPEREGVANILAAVNKDKVKQIIAISGLGAFNNANKPNGFTFIPNIIRKQGQRFIKESGIPYTFLHCSWFVDSFIVFRRNNQYSVIGDTKNPIYFTNCYNYSVHLANAIGNEEAFFKEFPIQGNEGLLHLQAAREFLSIYSPESKVSILPYGIISLAALFSKQMKFVKHMFDYSCASKETFLADDCETYKILGEPQLNLRQYAEKVKSTTDYN